MSGSVTGSRERGAMRATGGALVLSFGATLFLSALLLFSVQPMFAKMVLPRLGGSPAVWSVAMLFFQAALLAGYAYAHLLVRRAGRSAILIHGAVMAAALLVLPIGVAGGFDVPPGHFVPLWLLALFAASIGLPFFAVAANAPLLQAWFSRTGDPHAADPYFLYGASNIGSFAALIAYPVVLEPLFTLSAQATLWTALYVILGIAVIGCGLVALRRQATAIPAMAEAGPAAPVTWAMRARWIGFAFLPSALLVAVTAHISINVAAAPFLWVMPLALFLLTFALTFQRERLIPHRTMQLMLPLVVALAIMTVIRPGIFGGLGGIAVGLFSFFVIAMTWHGELVLRRPAAIHLTDFYLAMSVGGVLGGAFTSLAAPVLFDTVAEFPLLLVASLLALPEARAVLRRPVGYGGICAAVLLMLFADFVSQPDFRERSFFGVTTVRASPDGRFRLLYHGTTIHGAEKVTDLAGDRPEPITYFTEEGPLARSIRIHRARVGHPLSVAVIGLGTGSMACHAAPGENWRFYEIDPAIIRVVADPNLFTFVPACTPDAPIIVGDARLTIAQEPAAAFDVIVIDAFSSDAIPAHLLTREAFRTYFGKLRPDGIIAMNITNKFVELPSVVGATTQAEGLSAAFMRQSRTPEELNELRAYSDVAVVTRDAPDLAPFLDAGFTPIPAPGSQTAPWTDDYSNIVAALLRKRGLL